MPLRGDAGKVANGSHLEAPRPDQRFPAACRLTSRRQFLLVYAEGRRVGSRSFTIFGRPNDLAHCRLGLTVTRKVGPSAFRNRVKRRLREVFRRNRTRLRPALDLVVNAHRTIRPEDADGLEEEFLSSFARLARGLER